MNHHFKQSFITTSQGRINTFVGGDGFPLLLLHGYPQTSYMWHKIALRLAQHFTVVATDLRGYGDSFKPQGSRDHHNYSKREVAKDQVEVMAHLGYEKFYLIGHDRGARVAHRLSLDNPDRIQKLVLLDIAPTYQMYTSADQAFSTAYYHWFFLIQPYPFPETLIAGNPEYFLRHCLQSWSHNFSTFTQDALREYIRCFKNPQTIHGTCEDYRASASIDLEHDKLDISTKIQCPLLILWGSQGVIEHQYDVLESWQQRAINVQGKAIDCGHFLPEEAPEETYTDINRFLRES